MYILYTWTYVARGRTAMCLRVAVWVAIHRHKRLHMLKLYATYHNFFGCRPGWLLFCRPAAFTTSDNYSKLRSYNTSRRWCMPRQLWPTRQWGGEQSDGPRPVCLISHMAALMATHNYETSLEICHLISKYWRANRWRKTITYGRKWSADSDSDSGKTRGFGCGFRILNNTSDHTCQDVVCRLLCCASTAV